MFPTIWRNHPKYDSWSALYHWRSCWGSCAM